MLEGGYAKLDTRRFNAASPGGQTNFAFSSGAGADSGSGSNKGSSSGKGRRTSRQSGSSSSSIRSEYRFVYFNGACAAAMSVIACRVRSFRNLFLANDMWTDRNQPEKNPQLFLSLSI